MTTRTHSPWTATLCLALATGCTGSDTGSGDGGSETGDPSSTAATMADGAGPAGGGPAGDDGATTVVDDGGPGSTDTVGDDTGTGDTTPTSSTGEGDSSGSGSGDDESGSPEDGGSESTGAVADDGPPELCEAPGNLVTCDPWGEPITIFNAMGLNCAGGPDEVIPIVGEGFNYVDPTSWAIATQLGTHIDPAANAPLWGPREGETLLVLSSGNAGIPDAAGVITHVALDDDDNGNPSDKPLPAPMTSATGSAGAPFVGCDGVGDCSDTLQSQWALGGSAANDLIWLQFATQVPGGTHGFSVDFAYFSEEFPEFVNDSYNDMLVVWSNSETYTGNLCFINDQPCTITALCDGDDSCPDLAFCGDTFNCASPNPDPPELAGTGFGTEGGTGWFQLKGSAEPLELLQLTFAVFDMGDEAYDTLVLLDNFAWDCEGCTPTEVNPCGVVDPV